MTEQAQETLPPFDEDARPIVDEKGYAMTYPATGMAVARALRDRGSAVLHWVYPGKDGRQTRNVVFTLMPPRVTEIIYGKPPKPEDMRIYVAWLGESASFFDLVSTVNEGTVRMRFKLTSSIMHRELAASFSILMNYIRHYLREVHPPEHDWCGPDPEASGPLRVEWRP